MIYGIKTCDCKHEYHSKLNHCPECGTSEAFADFKQFDPRDWIYDLETYPNIFTCDLYHPASDTWMLFEISDRKNDLYSLYYFLMELKRGDCRMVGFNNRGFDYPVIHFIIEHIHLAPTVTDIFNRAQSIIDTPWHRRYDNVIWDNEVHVQQIDLYLIHHFDNEARRTSLKMLEFNMCMSSIEDLPYPPGTVLNNYQKDILIQYNDHDVNATFDFYIHSIPLIEFRETLSEKYQRNFINHNDTKIGKDYFIMKLEEQMPGSCYDYSSGKRQMRQTVRESINLGEVVFPYIYFKNPIFESMLNYFKATTITETKGTFKDLSCTVDGFTFDFGAGGIHGSVKPQVVESDDQYVVEDWDVASYYPNLAIANRLYPEHLSEQFCEIYQDVFQQRRAFKKGTPENAMLKLALNGVYGDSNSRYSPFYDSKYTMSITINGQLLLCLLAQYLLDVPELQMIQINTDGLTVRYPRIYKESVHAICKWWEEYTRLELEDVIYKRMFIRDVNNYIGEYEDGKLKRKGAYEYELEWHQNHSCKVVAKAAESALVKDIDVGEFIRNHKNIHDFMLRAKVGRKDNLMWGEHEQQRISRYYVSYQGQTLRKISPPAKPYVVGQWRRANSLTDQFYNSVLAEIAVYGYPPGTELDATGVPWDERINSKSRTKYTQRSDELCKGWLTTVVNNIHDFDPVNLNYDYYINEANKLIDPIRGK